VDRVVKKYPVLRKIVVLGFGSYPEKGYLCKVIDSVTKKTSTMETIKICQKDNVSLALRNFALALTQGSSVGFSTAIGMDQIDALSEKEAYIEKLKMWADRKLEIEVEKMNERNGYIVGWETILV